MDQQRVKRFGQELLRRYGDAMTVLLIDLGDRTGLLAATADGGTSQEIATRAGLAERPVREWLHGMVVADIVDRMSRYRFDALLPEAEVIGFDAYAPGLDQARTEAEKLGLSNVRFEAADVAAVATHGPFDLVTAFDVIHDLGDPSGALAAIREALVDDGVFLLYDIGAPSDLDEQVTLPWAPLMYGFSLAYCVQGSLADGGAALGNMWGRERAESMLRDAGFQGVDVLDPPLDPINVLYVCRT